MRLERKEAFGGVGPRGCVKAAQNVVRGDFAITTLMREGVLGWANGDVACHDVRQVMRICPSADVIDHRNVPALGRIAVGRLMRRLRCKVADMWGNTQGAALR